MRTIVFNRSNIIPDGNNNQLVYRFPNSVKFKDSYIAVSQVNMYYSWLNISTELGNNTFAYNFWDGTAAAPITYTTHTIVIPDGLYQIEAINFYLQSRMIALGTYLIDNNQNNRYPIELQINPTAYAVQINTYSFPDPLTGGLVKPATWTYPVNWVSFAPQAAYVDPAQSFNAVITILPNFSNLVGYAPGFFTDQNINNVLQNPPLPPKALKDAATGTISYLSSTAPDVNPNSSVYMNLSNIDNVYSQPTGIIYSVTPKVVIGGQITEQPPQFAWNKLIEGTYNELRLTFLGIDLQPVRILDPNMTILMVIKDRNEL
tara:strand:- start:4878 stop:5828 length:951 start_codon:yes stop_codon:yes gene_type:complete